jgi:hypothetical protein
MGRVVRGWIVALLCVGWVSAQGWATAETPTAVIQQTTTQVLGILKDPSLQGPAKRQEREARLQDIGDQAFDGLLIGRVSHGCRPHGVRSVPPIVHKGGYTRSRNVRP